MSRTDNAPTLAQDLAQALHATADLPPWHCPGLTAVQQLNIQLQLCDAPLGTRWRYEALQAVQWAIFQARNDLADWETQYRALRWELEDEDEHAGRWPSIYHDCSRGRCDCVPPRRRTPVTPRQ